MASSATDSDAEGYDVATVTKTVILPLETSHTKNQVVQDVIDEWQTIAERVADLAPSLGPDHWRTQDTTLYHVVANEFPDHGLRTHDASQAAYKVGEAFASWHSNQHEKELPSFGDGNYARFCHCGVAVEKNQRGWGIKINVRPYNPVWWHIDARPYHRRHLRGITGDDLSTGSAELHLTDDGSLSCHLSVKRDVPVLPADATDQWMGVCLGEQTLYSAVVTDEYGDVLAVQMEPGDEFRHYRERLRMKRSRLMEAGDLRAVKQCRDEHRRYTDYMTHRVSREIVDLADDHGVGIRLEDMTHLRETAPDPIHDFPFDEVQTKVAYKATEMGLPVEFPSPAETKISCRKCGAADESYRTGPHFECGECGYEVHSFVNGAANVARSS